jgi:tRNA dimethylallyltransferase
MQNLRQKLDANALCALAKRICDSAEKDRELLAFVGPTASGKSSLAALVAERLDAEIVNVDSVQIYREFDCGSGKPTEEELRRVPHHFVSAFSPAEDIDAHQFASAARNTIDAIRGRGKRPILSGGTFLWMRAIYTGLAEAPKGNDKLRRAHTAFAQLHGCEALHARLATVDPTLHAKLHPNDLLRVSRALEVFELSGRPLSDFQREHAERGPLFDTRLIGIHHTDAALTDRIRARVVGFLQGGWQTEVASLHSRGFASARAMGSVGYREISDELLGIVRPGPQNDTLEEKIVRATRVFARRQRTWLAHQDVLWLTL